MKKRLLNLIKYTLLLILALFLVWLSLRSVSLTELWEKIKNARFIILLPTFIVLMLSHWIRALRWNLIIQSIHYCPSAKNSFLSLLLGYFCNLFLPRLGEVVRCTRLAYAERIPADKLIGTVIIERVIDMLVLIAITIAAFLIQLDVFTALLEETLPAFLSRSNRLIYIGLALLTGIAFVFWLIRQKSRYPWVEKIIHILRNITEGIGAIRHVQKKGLFVFYTAAMWFCYLLTVWLGCKALAHTDLLGFIPALSILVMGSVGMIVTQGGIGAYPLLVQKTAEWYQIAPIDGAALGWLLWSSQVAMTLAAGTIAWFLITARKQPYASPQ